MNLKNLVNSVICVLGGAALGGGASYFFAHREIVELHRCLNNLVSPNNARKKFEYKRFKVPENPTISPDSNTFDNGSVQIKIDPESECVTINNKSIQKPDITEFQKYKIVREMDRDKNETDSYEPYLIAENEIDSEDGIYDSEVAYTYYEDGILEDENGEIVVDPDDILPSGWRDCFGWNCRSDDKFFAVNPKLRLLIEVGRVASRYAEEWEE